MVAKLPVTCQQQNRLPSVTLKYWEHIHSQDYRLQILIDNFSKLMNTRFFKAICINKLNYRSECLQLYVFGLCQYPLGKNIFLNNVILLQQQKIPLYQKGSTASSFMY